MERHTAEYWKQGKQQHHIIEMLRADCAGVRAEGSLRGVRGGGCRPGGHCGHWLLVNGVAGWCAGGSAGAACICIRPQRYSLAQLSQAGLTGSTHRCPQPGLLTLDPLSCSLSCALSPHPPHPLPLGARAGHPARGRLLGHRRIRQPHPQGYRPLPAQRVQKVLQGGPQVAVHSKVAFQCLPAY